MLLTYRKKTFRHFYNVAKPFINEVFASKVKPVKFGDVCVNVTEFFRVPSVHPIPTELTTDLFDVEHLQDDTKPINTPLISPSSPEVVYNSYSMMLDNFGKAYRKYTDVVSDINNKKLVKEIKETKETKELKE